MGRRKWREVHGDDDALALADADTHADAGAGALI
jgi:hypothetical protein